MLTSWIGPVGANSTRICRRSGIPPVRSLARISSISPEPPPHRASPTRQSRCRDGRDTRAPRGRQPSNRSAHSRGSPYLAPHRRGGWKLKPVIPADCGKALRRGQAVFCPHQAARRSRCRRGSDAVRPDREVGDAIAVDVAQRDAPAAGFGRRGQNLLTHSPTANVKWG